MSASHIYSPMFSSESFMISDNVYRHTVMPDSLQPHGLQPTRLLRPWDFPGKSTGVGWHFLLQCMKVKSESEAAQSCPTLRDPMDFSPLGSSAHGIFQARALEWGAIDLWSISNEYLCMIWISYYSYAIGKTFISCIGLFWFLLFLLLAHLCRKVNVYISLDFTNGTLPFNQPPYPSNCIITSNLDAPFVPT